jgi:hypothetical protein
VHTIRDPKRIASMHARSAIGYVRSEHRLRFSASRLRLSAIPIIGSQATFSPVHPVFAGISCICPFENWPKSS